MISKKRSLNKDIIKNKGNKLLIRMIRNIYKKKMIKHNHRTKITHPFSNRC
jgi:hypothetical protein